MTPYAPGLPPAPVLPPVERSGPAAPPSPPRPASLFGRIADAHEVFLEALGASQARYRSLQEELLAVAAGSTQPQRWLQLEATPGGILAQLAELAGRRTVAIEVRDGLPRGSAAVRIQGETIGLHEAGGRRLASVTPSDTPVDRPVVDRDDAARRAAQFHRQLDALRRGRPDPALGPAFALTAAAVRPPAIGDLVPPALAEIIAMSPRAASGRIDGRTGSVVETALDAAIELAGNVVEVEGHTAGRDGWRFCLDASPDVRLSIRSASGGAAEVDVDLTPAAGDLAWTLRIMASIGTDEVLGCSGLVLALRPDWPEAPADAEPDLAALARLPPPLEQGGIVWDHRQLLASTRERPSLAYGSRFTAFDRAERIARLPGPPLMLMTRVFGTTGEPGSRSVGVAVNSGYVADPDAWYFTGPAADMPLAVLMEMLLQPCGWLTLFAGFVTTEGRPLRFRNLDGQLRLHERLRQSERGQVVVQRTELTNLTRIDDTVLLRFAVSATLDGRRLAELDTVFGYFTDDDLSGQAQLPAADRIPPDAEPLDRVDVDLSTEPDRFYTGTAALPGGRLRMVDAITGWSARGGAAGLGRLQARQWPAPDAWYFTAHFFQDPVQPGSLGVEGLRQALQAFAVISNLAGDTASVTPLVDAEVLRWKYRGQVLPGARQIDYDIEISDRRETADAVTLIARGALSVDGACIYRVDGLGLRIVAATLVEPEWRRDEVSVRTMPFLDDHRPTHTVPVMPLMGTLEMIAAELLARHPHRVLAAVEDLQVMRWMPVETAAPIRIVLDETDAKVSGRLEVWRTAVPESLSRFEPVATGTFILADAYPAEPEPLPPLGGAAEVPLPYESGAMFHGPAFRVLDRMQHGDRGATAIARVAGVLPIGALNPGLLDAALHPIPHDRMQLWFPDADERDIGYPSRIARLTFHRPTPHDGLARLEVRAGDTVGDSGRFFDYRIQISSAEGLWADLDIVTVSFRRSRPTDVPARLRRAVLTGERYFPAARLGEATADGAWRVRSTDIDAANWLPGTIERAFDVPSGAADAVVRIAQREALAQATALPPRIFSVADGIGTSEHLPFTRFVLATVGGRNEATVRVDEGFQPELCAPGSAELQRVLRERIGRVVAPRRAAPGGRATVVVDPSAAVWAPLLAAVARAAVGVDGTGVVVGLDSLPSEALLTRAFWMGERWDIRCAWAGDDPLAAWELLEPRRSPDVGVDDARLSEPDDQTVQLIEAMR